MAYQGEKDFVRVTTRAGGAATYGYHGRTSHTYVFGRDPKDKSTFTLFCPLSVWTRNNLAMARDLMDQIRLPAPLIVTFEKYDDPLERITGVSSQEPITGTNETGTEPEPEPEQDGIPGIPDIEAISAAAEAILEAEQPKPSKTRKS